MAAASGAPAERPEPPRLHLPIAEVTVYENLALVVREGEVTLAGGKVETVIIGGLPPALSETSLRAGFSDPAHGKVISVSSDVERRREIQDTRLRAVDEERRSTGRKIAEIDDELARLAARQKYLDAYEALLQKAVSERTGGGADLETSKWSDALRFVREGRSAALAARRDAERRRETLGRQHVDLEADAERLRRPEERSVRRAEVAVEAAGAGAVKLRLSYVIEGAGWSPRYDARFDAEKGELAVTYFGEVRQRTGEDWPQARLVLSTARPSVGASRPALLPLRLSSAPITGGAKGKGIEHREEAARVGGLDGAGLAVSEIARADTRLELEVLTTDTRENATSATFTVPGLVTIPSDERPHKVPVTTFRERAETAFETVPKLQRFVYLKCSARNGSPYPMLAGPVDIFRGSGFIGTASLKFVAPRRPFEISLGIEESLKVRRAVTADVWNERSKEKREGFDIEVANFGTETKTVTVLESYPIADIEEVRVRLDSSTTPPAEKDEKTGRLKWRLTLPPASAQQVHVEYTIDY